MVSQYKKNNSNGPISASFEIELVNLTRHFVAKRPAVFIQKYCTPEHTAEKALL